MSSDFEAVCAILREHCGVQGALQLESRLQEDLGLDSMGLLTLALETENHFDLCLDEPPDDPPRTIQALLDLVRQRLEDRHGAT